MHKVEDITLCKVHPRVEVNLSQLAL